MIKSFKTLLIIYLVLLSGCTTSSIVHPQHMPEERTIENVNVAIALGGGGTKGLVHLGVLEVFEENGIPVDLIVGTSAGSLIGSMYSDTQDTHLMKEKLLKLTMNDFIDVSIPNSLWFFYDIIGPVEGYYLNDFIVHNYTAQNIEDLRIPFVAVATDIENDKSISIDSGPITTAVHASSAIPPLFTPVKAYGKILVDGGVIEPVPVLTAKKYDPKVIIAVDISSPGKGFNMYNMLDVTYRSMYTSYYIMSRMQSSLADISIQPNLSGYGMFNDKNNEKLYELGRLEALKHIPQILKVLKKKNIPLKKAKLRLP